MWSIFRRTPAKPSPTLAEELLQTGAQTLSHSRVSTVMLSPLVNVLSRGLDSLITKTYTFLDPSRAREDLDTLVQRLPYQIAPEVYSQMATEPTPTFQPLYEVLTTLSPEDATSNFHYLYQHYLDLLNHHLEKPELQAMLQKQYLEFKPTIKPELLIAFLDIVPAGYLDQERGSLMGRDELLKVLDELRSEKDKVEAAKIRDEALLDSIGDGVVAVSSEQKVIFSNQSAREMLGLTEADLFEKKWFDIVHLVTEKGEPVATENRPMYQSLQTQKKISVNNLSFLKADNTALPASMTATPFILHDKPAGAILVFRDVTREREIDHQKTEFISVASHQLRTPLGSMKWNLEMLGKGYYGALPDDAQKIIADALSVNERTIRLVNTLLNISRIEEGRVPDHPVETDIKEVIAATLKEVEPLAQAKKVKLECKAEKSPVICIDAGRLREVLENIISNAVKYSAQGGSVDIDLKFDADSATIQVADQGMGIPEKEQFKVFSRFFRAENAISQEPNGSGFGLFVVKSYVEAWGGKVWFTSPTLPDNRGTSFYLQIPLVPLKILNPAGLDQPEAESGTRIGDSRSNPAPDLRPKTS